MNILCVCLGNICRSPAAEAILSKKLQIAGIKNFHVDSAGTSAYHQGEPADSRMLAALTRHNYPSTSLSRKVTLQDFQTFDLILAMDLSNLDNLRNFCQTDQERGKVFLMSQYTLDQETEVPDPYYGGEDGFETVIKLLERMSEAFVEKLN